MLIQKDTVIDGFRIVKLLGKGAMGAVYEAVDQNLGRTVALKVLSKSIVKKPKIISRFKQETTVLAKMQHPNIVKIYTYGNVDDTYYFAQEFVSGRDLQVILNEEGTFPEEEVFTIARSIADAYAHFHPMGIVHRDIKPANVMKLDSGPIKIMDFGLVHDEDQTRLTETGGIVGTLAYISPEVLEGEEPTQELDIYELGCLLYELLTGKMLLNNKLFLKAGFVELRKRLGALPDLSRDIDPRLFFVIKHCIHPDVRLRFSDGEQILTILDSTTAPVPDQLPPPLNPPKRKRVSKRIAAAGSSQNSIKVSNEGSHSPQSGPISPHTPAQGNQLKKVTAVFTTLITLLFIFMIYSRQGKNATPEDSAFSHISVVPSISQVMVRWKAREPHSFSWNLTPVHELDDNIIPVYNVVESEKNEHILKIDSLHLNTEYRLFLKSSSGETYTKDVRTLNAKLLIEPVVSRRRSIAEKNTKYSIYFETNIEAPMTVLVDALEPVKPITTKALASHTANFELDAEKNKDAIVTITILYNGYKLKSFVLRKLTQSSFSAFRDNDIYKGRNHDFKEFDWSQRNSHAPYRLTAGPVEYKNLIVTADKNGFVYAIKTGANGKSDLAWAMRLPVDKSGCQFRAVKILTNNASSLLVVARNRFSIRTFFINSPYREKLWPSLLSRHSGSPLKLAQAKDWARTDPSRGEFVSNMEKPYLAGSQTTPWGSDKEGNLYLWCLTPDMTAENDAVALMKSQEDMPKKSIFSPQILSHYLFCFHPESNILKWAYRVAKPLKSASKAVINRTNVYATIRENSNKEYVVVLDKANGREKAKVPLEMFNSPFGCTAPLPLENNTVFAGSGKTVNLIRFDVKDTKSNEPSKQRFPLSGFVLGGNDRYKNKIYFSTVHKNLISKQFSIYDFSIQGNFITYSDTGFSDHRNRLIEKNCIDEDLREDRMIPLYRDNTLYLPVGSKFIMIDTSNNGGFRQDPYTGRVNTPLLIKDQYIYFSSSDSNLYKCELN